MDSGSTYDRIMGTRAAGLPASTRGAARVGGLPANPQVRTLGQVNLATQVAPRAAPKDVYDPVQAIAAPVRAAEMPASTMGAARVAGQPAYTPAVQLGQQQAPAPVSYPAPLARPAAPAVAGPTEMTSLTPPPNPQYPSPQPSRADPYGVSQAITAVGAPSFSAGAPGPGETAGPVPVRPTDYYGAERAIAANPQTGGMTITDGSVHPAIAAAAYGNGPGERPESRGFWDSMIGNPELRKALGMGVAPIVAGAQTNEPLAGAEWGSTHGTDLPPGVYGDASASANDLKSVTVPRPMVQPGSLGVQGTDINPGDYHQQYQQMIARQNQNEASRFEAQGNQLRATIENANAWTANRDAQDRARFAETGLARRRAGKFGDAEAIAARAAANATEARAGVAGRVAPVNRNFIAEAATQGDTFNKGVLATQAAKRSVQMQPLDVAAQQQQIAAGGVGLEQHAIQLQALQQINAMKPGPERDAAVGQYHAIYKDKPMYVPLHGSGGAVTDPATGLPIARPDVIGMGSAITGDFKPAQGSQQAIAAPAAGGSDQTFEGKKGTPYEGKKYKVVNGQPVEVK